MRISFTEWNGRAMSDSRIEEMVRETVRDLQNGDSNVAWSWCGDTAIIASKFGNEVEVLVTKVLQRGEGLSVQGYPHSVEV